ncbi:vWA domain-containing protein [Dulcicalothrix desertica]|nr:vWA domain-containing protein [Dulcicalothrix desertica]TWH62542.1 von Willebrand factor type A domain-containing protein [Dulcicalothrix desertica PCC 7102]
MRKKSIDLSTTIAFWIRRLSISTLMLACFSNPSLAQVKNAEIIGAPTVNEDRVTIRIKVKGKEDKPVMGLLDTDFRLLVDNKEVKFKPKDWKNPEQSIPPPAWIIVLLDFSGSMRQPDSRGKTKLEGAISAIREFSQVLAERGGNTQLAIVPFGTPGDKCEGYVVNNDTLDKFFPAGDFKLENHLNYLSGLTPCASTNLYEPLTKALRFLGNTEDRRFYVPEGSQEPQPRLSVILLSDGYHNAVNEEQDFRNLERLLRINEGIIVHSLGYGLTPEQLGAKYKLTRAATRKDLGKGAGKVPEEEFVDRDRLKQIANLSGGINEFSGNAQAIASNLKLFLDALLGEYEISYTEPNPERGSKHKVYVELTSSGNNAVVKSEPKPYSIFWFTLPPQVRHIMLLCVLLILGLGGVLPFWLWGKRLKEQALEDY